MLLCICVPIWWWNEQSISNPEVVGYIPDDYGRTRLSSLSHSPSSSSIPLGGYRGNSQCMPEHVVCVFLQLEEGSASQEEVQPRRSRENSKRVCVFLQLEEVQPSASQEEAEKSCSSLSRSPSSYLPQHILWPALAVLLGGYQQPAGVCVAVCLFLAAARRSAAISKRRRNLENSKRVRVCVSAAESFFLACKPRRRREISKSLAIPFLHVASFSFLSHGGRRKKKKKQNSGHPKPRPPSPPGMITFIAYAGCVNFTPEMIGKPASANHLLNSDWLRPVYQSFQV